MAPLQTDDMTGSLLKMASGEQSQLGQLVKGGSVDEAAQMALAVLSMVDTSDTGVDEQDKKGVSKEILF